jgi:hypothetical protein
MVMKLRYLKFVGIMLVLLTAEIFAEEPSDRYQVVVDSMVKAINSEDYPGIQKDFGKVMLDAFPLEQAKPFFKRLMRDAGKIKKLDNPRLVPPNQAIFPAHFEKTVLDIKIVLDGHDKIIGLWFLPHVSEIPVPEEHTAVLELPFDGEWKVFWGGDTEEQNHHHSVASQKYAFDLLRVDKNGKRYKNQGEENEDYFAFGKKVLAPADGVVTEVIRGVRDNRPGSMNPYSALGNTVFIEHGKNEVSVLAHFKQKSILVKVGDKVRKGQPLGLCGNSGNSSEPHIHYHLQNTPIIQDGAGIKCVFENVIVSQNGKEQLKEKYSPLKGDIVRIK